MKQGNNLVRTGTMDIYFSYCNEVNQQPVFLMQLVKCKPIQPTLPTILLPMDILQRNPDMLWKENEGV